MAAAANRCRWRISEPCVSFCSGTAFRSSSMPVGSRRTHGSSVSASRAMPTKVRVRSRARCSRSAMALVAEFYRRYAIRATEFGTLTFATKDPATGQWRHPALEMVRLAVPRRVYTSAHLQYAADAAIELYARRTALRGLKITHEAE